MRQLIFISGRTVLTIVAMVALVAGAHAQSDLDRAYRIIAGKPLADLTHSFGPDSPV